MISRINPGWRSALAREIERVRRLPFQYGRHDCALFAAGVVAAMTGTDLGEPFRGRYTTMLGGVRRARELGYADHVDVFARALPEIKPVFAQQGDVAVIPADPGESVGIVTGAEIHVVMPGQCLGVVPLTAAIRAFRV